MYILFRALARVSLQLRIGFEYMAAKRKDSVLAPLECGNQKYAIRSNADIVCFTGNTGGGKLNPLDEPVLTVDGWKLMGDIKLGDKLVAPLNSEESVVTGIFPQGVKPIYKVTTSDGRTSRCGLEHLWMIRTKKQRDEAQSGKLHCFYVKTTKEIIEDYLNKGKAVYLPIALPYKGKEKNLPLDPYVLGVWLGDGCSGHKTLTISNDEQDVIKKVAERLGSTYHFHSKSSYSNLFHRSSNAVDTLKVLGLDTYSHLRFIPEEYLHASIEQRLDLLKGLMDSDGSVGKKNRFSFSTTSERLKDGFLELCRSLGYIVGVHKEKRTKYKSGNAWKVSIQTNDIIFSSEKHLKRYYGNLDKNNGKNREYKHQHIRIAKIEYVGDMAAQCIMVSNKDHLYITNDYIVTHNTIALYYAPIQYLAENDNAKIVCFMRNVSDFWGSGKVADSLKKMYPLVDRAVKKQPRDPIGEIIRKQEDMGMKLYNGSEIKFQQLDNENPTVIDKIAKGLQAKKLIFDECNKFLWSTITAFLPRLRSDSNGKAQVFLAQNPERECFMRKLCGKGEHGGGWINDDGTIDKSMDGVVMYFNMQEGDLDKTYFGRTKKEVYEKCKDHIDSLIALSPDMTYEDFILSMVFYTFDVRDNKAMLAKNKSYRGLAANASTALSAYNANWNYSITDEEKDVEEFANVQVTTTDVERMFRPMERPHNSELLKRFMTIDFATTGFDNLVMKSWEFWSHYGFLCNDIRYSMRNTNREAVMMIVDFRDRMGLSERDMIIDVQGFGFLRDCFPKAIQFAGAAQPSKRSKNLYKSLKDEAAHLAMEMILSGLIHYDPKLAEARYNHQNMKRVGATTILRQMKFESAIFQFNKTPNGRIVFLDKDKQHTILKGMSPDLFDNVIMLCGGTYYDCYRMLSTDAGVTRKRIQSEDMFAMLNVNNVPSEEDSRIVRRKIRNADDILNILSSI